jgi:hypothetical protein
MRLIRGKAQCECSEKVAWRFILIEVGIAYNVDARQIVMQALLSRILITLSTRAWFRYN